ncbi:hypothetical protein WDW86_21245 [Bdellovibrionota bacterium FG-2]
MKTTAVSGLTTGIGSLPHHNIDAALAFSFKMGIPFLPQIPIRNPWEFMIAQALEGLPGLQVDRDGSITLNPDIWNAHAHALEGRLNKALTDDGFLETFEPSSATSSSWQPFLWELEEQASAFPQRLAKIQIAGPLTSQWALRFTDGTPADREPALTTQIFRLILARALAMSKRLQKIGYKPILFLDEPGLYGYSMTNPKHLLGLQELRVLIQTLQKQGVVVGVHCCGNTEWNALLELPLDILSIDAKLSLQSLLQARASLDQFLDRKGLLSLGVVPTARSSLLHSLTAEQLFLELLASLKTTYQDRPARIQEILKSSLYTPACGLALHSGADCEHILRILRGVLGQFQNGTDR